jgi:histidinol dehydrogenase
MAQLPLYDLSTAAGRNGFDACLARLRRTASASGDAAAVVAEVLADVRERGDYAVVASMRRWTDPRFTADRIRVDPRALTAALKNLEKPLRTAMQRAIENVRAYQQYLLPEARKPLQRGDALLGIRYSPVESVGLTVPGGTAVLFSTLIMLAVPAIVAGVKPGAISVIHPPPTRRHGDSDSPELAAGDISPIVMAACAMLGIERLYRIGGAQGVAALAYGTASVEPVAMLAGPGNVYVQLAKQQVAGVVGTDGGFYGPSEIPTIADASADARRVAADLLAQAEHDPGKCYLVSWSRDVLQRVLAEVEAQQPQCQRREAIARALARESAAVLVRDEQQAVEVANAIAAEHVNLAVADPTSWLDRVRHGGEFFLGDNVPVAAGDYYAGPSHCLPTGSTARFASGVSVHTFLKRSGTVAYPDGMSAQTIADIALLAEAEGLDAHARSARARG